MKSVKKSKRRALTPKQLKFIAFYAGNGTDAARKAGYAGDDEVLRSVAYENLTKPHIREAIRKRTDQEIEPLVATRLDRQKFWSKVMKHSQTAMRDRLKAAELLGKSQADFIDVVQSKAEVKTELRIVSEVEVEAALEKFNREY